MYVELLKGIRHTCKAKRILKFIEEAVRQQGDTLRITNSYVGRSPWLILYGVGAEPHARARDLQRNRGHTLMFDMGYTNRAENYRLSIDDDHPHRWLDKTPDGDWTGELKDTFNPDGPIILVGLGRKSKSYLGEGWEAHQMSQLRREFPGKQIILKEKTDPTPFEDLLQGASLVVARHSNCCVDAVIHNVPFRCQDGAAYWLKDLKDRELFLSKLSHWQTTAQDVGKAWKFAKWITQSV